MINHHQLIDNSLRGYRQKFQPIGRKMAELWPKKRMPIYGVIDILRSILAYNLAKY